MVTIFEMDIADDQIQYNHQVDIQVFIQGNAKRYMLFGFKKPIVKDISRYHNNITIINLFPLCVCNGISNDKVVDCKCK